MKTRPTDDGGVVESDHCDNEERGDSDSFHRWSNATPQGNVSTTVELTKK